MLCVSVGAQRGQQYSTWLTTNAFKSIIIEESPHVLIALNTHAARGRKRKGQFVYIFKLSTAIGPGRPALLAEQRFEKRKRLYQNMMCFPEQILLACC